MSTQTSCQKEEKKNPKQQKTKPQEFFCKFRKHLRGKTNILRQETRPAFDTGLDLRGRRKAGARKRPLPGSGRRGPRSSPRTAGPRPPFHGKFAENLLICMKHLLEGERKSLPLASCGFLVHMALSGEHNVCGEEAAGLRGGPASIFFFFSHCVIHMENYQYLAPADSFNLPVFVQTFEREHRMLNASFMIYAP